MSNDEFPIGFRWVGGLTSLPGYLAVSLGVISGVMVVSVKFGTGWGLAAIGLVGALNFLLFMLRSALATSRPKTPESQCDSRTVSGKK